LKEIEAHDLDKYGSKRSGMSCKRGWGELERKRSQVWAGGINCLSLQQKPPDSCLVKTNVREKGPMSAKSFILAQLYCRKTCILTDHTSYHEEDAVAALAAGKTDAFDRIYYHYYKAVRANIFKIVKDESMTDDILSEVFINLWDKRERFA
jgi:hypothetical protein